MKKIFIILLLTVFLSGCMSIRVKDDIDYPVEVFEKAMKKIEKIQIKDPHRKGKVHRFNILVYDGGDREMVKLSVRKWLAQLVLNEALDDELEDIGNHPKRYGNIVLKEIKNLNRLGPGLLLEVEDKEEKTHVLMWLD